MGTSATAGPDLKFTVKYRGPDVDRGRMSALDLGPAIFGVGEMVGEASRVLFNDETRVKVEVEADFPHASFGIDFHAVATIGSMISNLTMEDLANITQILGFTGATGYGALKLLRWQRGRKVDKVEQVGDNFRLTINDNSVDVTVNEYKIFISPTVRTGFKKLVEPLESEGVREVAIQAEGEPEQRIDRSEREYLTASPLPEQDVSTNTSEAVLEIIGLSFRRDNKWRFAQGEATFFAEIQDKVFLRKVAGHRELFGAGDALRVNMETRTTRVGMEFRFERAILRVLAHLPAMPGGGQLPLDGLE